MEKKCSLASRWHFDKYLQQYSRFWSHKSATGAAV